MQFRCFEANKIIFFISVGSFQQAIGLARNQMSGLSFPRIANISAKSAQLLLNRRREQLTPVTCSPLEAGRGNWYLSVSLGNKGPLAGHLNATHSWVSCKLEIAKHVKNLCAEAAGVGLGDICWPEQSAACAEPVPDTSCGDRAGPSPLCHCHQS